MRDFEKEKQDKRQIIICVIALVVMVALFAMLFRSCSKSDEPIGGAETTEMTAKNEENSEPESIASDSNAAEVLESRSAMEELINAGGISEDIIKEILTQQEEEGVDPDAQAEAWEKGLSDHTKQNANGEGSDEETRIELETEFDPNEPQTNADGEEYGRQFNYKGTLTPNVDSEGRLQKSVVDRVEDAYVAGSGPLIGENSSTTMTMRDPVIKDLYTTGTGDHTGDTILFGDLAMSTHYSLSEPGYYVETSGNSAVYTFPDLGQVTITKLSKNFDVSAMSIAQLMELGGIDILDEENITRPSSGTYTAYSYTIYNEDHTRCIYCYSTPYGTYQVLHISSGLIDVNTLSTSLTPDEKINSSPRSDTGFTIVE